LAASPGDGRKRNRAATNEIERDATAATIRGDAGSPSASTRTSADSKGRFQYAYAYNGKQSKSSPIAFQTPLNIILIRINETQAHNQTNTKSKQTKRFRSLLQRAEDICLSRTNADSTFPASVRSSRAGIITGLILTAIGIIAALRWPEPRDSVRPQFFAVAGDKPMLHPGFCGTWRCAV
jgi:hypothetical protein